MLKDIELVLITIDDYQFGYEIKKITLKEYTEKTWGDKYKMIKNVRF